MNRTVRVPKVGEDVYIETSGSCEHGRDDVIGGLAKITSVHPAISDGKVVAFVGVVEHPGCDYNWEILAGKQEELKKKFGGNRAHRDPDHRSECNEP